MPAPWNSCQWQRSVFHWGAKKQNTNISRCPQETISDLQQFGKYELPRTSHNYPAGQPKARCPQTNTQVLGKGVCGNSGSSEDQRPTETLRPRACLHYWRDKDAEKSGVELSWNQEKDGKRDRWFVDWNIWWLGKRKGRGTDVRSRKSESRRWTNGIDLLADRVAEVVKMEVLRFFQRGEG